MAAESSEPDFQVAGGDIDEYLRERKKEAFDVGWPAPGEVKDRISLITNLSGKAPPIVLTYLAFVEWEVNLAIMQARAINWDKVNPTLWLLRHAPSLRGRSREQIVEIGRSIAAQTKKKSLFESVLGK